MYAVILPSSDYSHFLLVLQYQHLLPNRFWLNLNEPQWKIQSGLILNENSTTGTLLSLEFAISPHELHWYAHSWTWVNREDLKVNGLNIARSGEVYFDQDWVYFAPICRVSFDAIFGNCWPYQYGSLSHDSFCCFCRVHNLPTFCGQICQMVAAICWVLHIH